MMTNSTKRYFYHAIYQVNPKDGLQTMIVELSGLVDSPLQVKRLHEAVGQQLRRGTRHDLIDWKLLGEVPDAGALQR